MSCEAIQRFLTARWVLNIEKIVRGTPVTLAAMQVWANVRIPPVTGVGERVFSGPFEDQYPLLAAALQGNEA